MVCPGHLPPGRAGILERLDALLGDEIRVPLQPPADPHDQLRDDILSHWGSRVELMELHGQESGQQILLVVADKLENALVQGITEQLRQQFPQQAPQLKLLDRDTHDTIQQLIKAGVLQTGESDARILYQASATNPAEDA